MTDEPLDLDALAEAVAELQDVDRDTVVLRCSTVEKLIALARRIQDAEVLAAERTEDWLEAVAVGEQAEAERDAALARSMLARSIADTGDAKP